METRAQESRQPPKSKIIKGRKGNRAMKRTVKKLALLTIAVCLVLSIGEMSKSRAFAGSMAWVASVDSQTRSLPVYAEASDNSGIVGSLQRCAKVDLTGNEQDSWVEISQPMTGWVKSNLLSLDATLCSQRSAQSYRAEPSVSVQSYVSEPNVSGAAYGLGPDITLNGFGPSWGWGPQPHWEPGHWVPGHMVGQHWVPGHFVHGHFIPGHWAGGHWVPGHQEPGQWVMHNGHNGNHPISLTKANNVNKFKHLSLNKANNVNKFKSLSLNKAKFSPKLKATSINKKSPLALGKINQSMKLKSGLQASSLKSASFKGGFKHAAR